MHRSVDRNANKNDKAWIDSSSSVAMSYYMTLGEWEVVMYILNTKFNSTLYHLLKKPTNMTLLPIFGH